MKLTYVNCEYNSKRNKNESTHVYLAHKIGKMLLLLYRHMYLFINKQNETQNHTMATFQTRKKKKQIWRVKQTNGEEKKQMRVRVKVRVRERKTWFCIRTIC